MIVANNGGHTAFTDLTGIVSFLRGPGGFGKGEEDAPGENGLFLVASLNSRRSGMCLFHGLWLRCSYPFSDSAPLRLSTSFCGTYLQLMSSDPYSE